MTLYDDGRRILASVACPESEVERQDFSGFLSAQRAAARKAFHGEPVPPLELVATAWATLILERPRKAKKMADAINFLEEIETDPEILTIECARASLVVAIVNLVGADLPHAMRAARVALHYAAEDGAHQEEAAAHSLLAAVLALCGHYRTAVEHLAAAKEIEEEFDLKVPNNNMGWQLHPRWPMLFADLLVNTRRGGLEFGANIAKIPLEPSTNGMVSAYRLYQNVVGQMIRGDFLTAHSHCELYRSQPDHGDGIPLFDHLFLGAEALCLLQTERPGAILSLLDGVESPSCQFVPYDSLLANAYILLGNPTKALERLAASLDTETPQCVSARASTLLREAVANEMLGDHAAADLAFFQAWTLAEVEEGAVPPIGLPLPILETLQGRLAASSPEMVEKLAERPFSRFDQRHAESPPCNCADLTPRELALAEQLAAGKTFAEIAEQTFRSPNTLKAQSRSLYKKLQVESREEAIAVLKRAGFFT